MNEAETTGVCVHVALAARARSLSWEAAQRSVALARAAEAADATAGGGAQALKRTVRPVFKALYKLVKPMARPIAFRLRNYLIGSLQAEAARSNELSQSRLGDLCAELQSIRGAIAQIAQQRGDVEALALQLRQDLDGIRGAVAKVGAGTADFQNLESRLLRIEQYANASARRMAVSGRAGEVLVRTAVGYLVCPSTDYALLAILLDAGELEPGTRQLIEKLVRPGDTFIDVGANVGMHTIAAARAMNGQGCIIAFEPHPATYGMLGNSLLLNGFAGIAAIHQAAVSNRTGRHPLFLGATSGHHSLYAPGAASGSQAETINVPLVRIDDVVDPALAVDVIKIDVEGAELEALEGAIATIKRNADVALIVEFGESHLRRAGHTAAHWLGAFERLGMHYQAIEAASGELIDWTPGQAASGYSVNLLFARPESKAWQRAQGAA